jgi:hypothetical protein
MLGGYYMSAFAYLDNDIKLQYLDLVCTDRDTSFLYKYLFLPELKRLGGIMQFCSCDNTNIHNSIIAYFTRLDHSLVVAEMTYHFTGSKAQAIAALFHDVLTPAFAHANDFRKGDTLNQTSSETNKYKTFTFTKELIEYLKEDGLTPNNILSIKKYPILENNKPKLCTDRLDGVIHTNLIWRPYWEVSDVENIYNDLTVLKNEDRKPEIGFRNVEIAEEFGNGVSKYSIALQSNEDAYSLQFTGDILQALVDDKLITEADIHKNLSEDQIEYIILNSRLKEVWQKFNNASEIVRGNRKPKDKDAYYYHNVNKVKKRVVDPLCLYNGNVYRLSEISEKFHQQLQDYFAFKDSEYSYVKNINKFR